MCSANKVAFVDAMNGTNLFTFTATGAERIVDNRQIIGNRDRSVRAGLLTLHTANTAVGAVFACLCTLIVIGAFNHYARCIVDEMNNGIGARAYTNAASNTFTRVNMSDAVFYCNCVLRTNRRAVPITETRVCTELITVVRHVCGITGLLSLVIILSLYCVAGSVTGNVSNLLDNVLGFHTENACDLFCSAVTAGNAKIRFITGSLCQSLCITVTAGISASAAVGTGETIANCRNRLVLFDAKELVGYRQKHRTNQGGAE